jgi:pyruvate dehydrogenase E2 component (dihydrolipoamide acetyltransferase)
MASPASRRRAREAGIDLAQVQGSGPHGRITRHDLDTALHGAAPVAPATAAPRAAMALARRTGTEEVKWSMLGSMGIAHGDDIAEE